MNPWIAWLKEHKPWTWVFSGIGVVLLSWVLNGWLSKPQSQSVANRDISIGNNTSQGGIIQTNTGGINAAHTGAGNIQIGITLEQYETRLKRREAEVEKRLEQAHAQDREALLIEQQALQQRLQDAKHSYQAHIADLRKRIAQLETIRGDVPDELLDQAKIALANGDTRKADALFQRVEDQAQGPIKAAAEAAYQRCQIAKDEVHYRQANTHCQRAVQLSPDNTLYLNGAGELAHMLGQYHKAIEYYELALASDLKTYGADHPQVAIRRNNLGLAWNALGQYRKAIEYYELALASGLKTYGADHPQVATRHNNLGSAWNALGQYRKAIEYYELALTVFKQKLGDDHPNTRTVRDNLSDARQKMVVPASN